MKVYPLLSHYARKKKIDYFIRAIPKDCRILEIGCGDGWVRDYLFDEGFSGYVGLDIKPPADIVGDISNWQALGIKENSFDVIIAFEVVEHVDCFRHCYKILKPGGKLMVTTPVPAMDLFLMFLEAMGFSQKRTSPHANLVNLDKIDYFRGKNIKIIGFLSQWAVFTK